MKFRFVLPAAAIALAMISCNEAPATRQVIFDTADSIGVPYRIPAIASFDDGTLTAVVDYRHCRSVSAVWT